jgi:competence protein ComEA
MNALHFSCSRALIGPMLAAVAVVALPRSAAAAESAAATAHAPASAAAPVPTTKKTSVVPSGQQVDINSASLERLRTLPGIGSAEAAKIAAGRPYYSKTDLVTRGVLPEGAYAAIKYRVFAVPPPAAKSSPKK